VQKKRTTDNVKSGKDTRKNRQEVKKAPLGGGATESNLLIRTRI